MVYATAQRIETNNSVKSPAATLAHSSHGRLVAQWQVEDGRLICRWIVI